MMKIILRKKQKTKKINTKMNCKMKSTIRRKKTTIRHKIELRTFKISKLENDLEIESKSANIFFCFISFSTLFHTQFIFY